MNKDYQVSEEEAILIAENHFQSMAYNKSQKVSDPKIVKRISQIKGENTDNALIYILEYEERGFCVVSADRRFDPILAYSETNNWGGIDLKGPNIFLNIYKDAIIKIRQENKEPSGEIRSAWNRLETFIPGRSSKPEYNPEIMSECYYGDCLPIYCEYSYSIDVGPLTDPISKWRQGGSFSYYSPTDNSCECDRKLAGCGPVALAILLRYHESPLMNMSFNGDVAYTDYNNMPVTQGLCTDNSGGYKSSSMLIALCGSAMNSNYGVLGNCNTSTHPNRIGDGLDWFGYSHDGKGDLDDRYNMILITI